MLSVGLIALAIAPRSSPAMSTSVEPVGLVRWNTIGFTYIARVWPANAQQLAAHGGVSTMLSGQEHRYRHLLSNDYWAGRCELGWPWRSFRCDLVMSPDRNGTYVVKARGGVVIKKLNGFSWQGHQGPASYGPVWRAIPFQPILKGAIGNSFVFGFMAYAVHLGVGSVRRIIRVKQNRCPACGYSVLGVPGRQCPECGRVAKALPQGTNIPSL